MGRGACGSLVWLEPAWGGDVLREGMGQLKGCVGDSMDGGGGGKERVG
jgi:hypothetical protein